MAKFRLKMVPCRIGLPYCWEMLWHLKIQGSFDIYTDFIKQGLISLCIKKTTFFTPLNLSDKSADISGLRPGSVDNILKERFFVIPEHVCICPISLSDVIFTILLHLLVRVLRSPSHHWFHPHSTEPFT